jgi:transposase
MVFELWIGDPAEIKAKRVKKQKYDREDARLLLRLMRENNFPKIWVPSPENRDLRQLLWHRHRLVEMRTRIMNQLQALAMNEGQRRKSKLWSGQGRAELEKLPLAPWASRRRQELLQLLDGRNPTIDDLTAAAEQEARKRPDVLRLMTHPGVGALTALAYGLIIGTPERFHRGKQIGTYIGMIPSEDGNRTSCQVAVFVLRLTNLWPTDLKPGTAGGFRKGGVNPARGHTKENRSSRTKTSLSTLYARFRWSA